VFKPAAIFSVSKYGDAGGCSAEWLISLNLPEEASRNIANMANFGLAQNTWSTYRTAEAMRLKCAKDTGEKLELPWQQRDTLIFVHWLDTVRKVSAGTISAYLAGIRSLHRVRGLEEPKLKSGLTKMVLAGKKNRDSVAAVSSVKKVDLPVTINLLKLVKEKLRRSKLKVAEQRLIWAVATVAFYGSFRIHEILAKHESFFDPCCTLLAKNVVVNKLTVGGSNKTALAITVKAPKEKAGMQKVVVDVFETNDATCPVAAFEKWRKVSNIEQDMPLFSSNNGIPLTGRKLNAIMTTLLQDEVDFTKYNITTRSFRRGLASMLSAKGLAEDEIKATGRWSSRAFEHYAKMPRTKRAELAIRINKT